MAFFGLLDKKKKSATIPVPPPGEMEDYSLPEKEYVEEAKPQVITKDHPLFIEVHNYESVHDSLKDITGYMQKTEASLETLNATHSQKEKTYSKWVSTVKEIQEKLLYVDEELFGRGE